MDIECNIDNNDKNNNNVSKCNVCESYGPDHSFRTKNRIGRTDFDVNNNSDNYVSLYGNMKDKYLKLSNLSTENDYAISFLCIVNEEYVLGACITAYSHRLMLKDSKFVDNVDLIILCDEYIYKNYYSILSTYFDKVIMVETINKDISNKYKFSEKYKRWISKSLTKWKVLNMAQYKKILFVDIANIPVDVSVYDYFKTDNIEIIVRKKKGYNTVDCLNKKYKSNIDKKLTYEKYIDSFDNKENSIYGTMHGSFVCIKPNKELYDKYVKFTDKIYSDGIYSIYTSGPDETSLFYFLNSNYGDKVKDVCIINKLVPWDDKVYIDESKMISYTSYYKPWIKPRILCWDEELLWHDIYDMMIDNTYNNNLDQLYKLILRRTTNLYKKLYGNPKTKRRATKCFTRPRLSNMKILSRKYKLRPDDHDKINSLENKNDGYGIITNTVKVLIGNHLEYTNEMIKNIKDDIKSGKKVNLISRSIGLSTNLSKNSKSNYSLLNEKDLSKYIYRHIVTSELLSKLSSKHRNEARNIVARYIFSRKTYSNAEKKARKEAKKVGKNVSKVVEEIIDIVKKNKTNNDIKNVKVMFEGDHANISYDYKNENNNLSFNIRRDLGDSINYINLIKEYLYYITFTDSTQRWSMNKIFYDKINKHMLPDINIDKGKYFVCFADMWNIPPQSKNNSKNNNKMIGYNSPTVAGIEPSSRGPWTGHDSMLEIVNEYDSNKPLTFYINPPFTEHMLCRVAEESIKFAEKVCDMELNFIINIVVVGPYWSDSKFVSQLDASEFKKKVYDGGDYKSKNTHVYHSTIIGNDGSPHKVFSPKGFKSVVYTYTTKNC